MQSSHRSVTVVKKMHHFICCSSLKDNIINIGKATRIHHVSVARSRFAQICSSLHNLYLHA